MEINIRKTTRVKVIALKNRNKDWGGARTSVFHCCNFFFKPWMCVILIKTFYKDVLKN